MACKSCKCGKHANEKVIDQMDDLTKPFTEEVYSSDTVLRHFDKSASEHLYKWHADVFNNKCKYRVIILSQTVCLTSKRKHGFDVSQ